MEEQANSIIDVAISKFDMMESERKTREMPEKVNQTLTGRKNEGKEMLVSHLVIVVHGHRIMEVQVDTFMVTENQAAKEPPPIKECTQHEDED